MRMQTNCGTVLIDYYPTKSLLTNKLIPDLNLKVVTRLGKTLYKVLMNDYAAGDDIIRKNDSGDYVITDNTKLPPQFVSIKEEELHTKWN